MMMQRIWSRCHHSLGGELWLAKSDLVKQKESMKSNAFEKTLLYFKVFCFYKIKEVCNCIFTNPDVYIGEV